MTTVREIALEAMSAVAAEVEGVIKSITFERETTTEYDPETGTVTSEPEEASATGVQETGEDKSLVRDYFPDYVVTGAETVWVVVTDGFVPREGDRMTADGVARTVMRSVDILSVGQLHRVMVV